MTIYWGLAGQTFTLTTSCSQVLERARTVLARWLQTEPQHCLCHWTANRTSSGWELHREEETLKLASVDEVVIWLEYGAIQRLELPGRLKVHGALLSPPGQQRALLILGHGGAGKSTLATALFASGWTLLSDDISFLDCEQLTAQPAPRRVALREESRPLLGEELWGRILSAPSSYRNQRGPLFHAHELSGRSFPNEVPLGAVVLLRKDVPSSPITLIDPAQAVFAMTAHSVLFSSGGLGAALPPLSQLADGLPVYQLTRAPLAVMEESLLSLGTATA
jgi:hypothetical protein